VILSDGEIRREIENGNISIDPPLTPDELTQALTTSAIDLRLGDELQLYKDPAEVLPIGLADSPAINPAIKGVIPDLIAKCAAVRSIADDYYDIQPHEFILGSTLEPDASVRRT
jgi:deoxycytidine triphosphate deaminase